MSQIPLLGESLEFPDTITALDEPNGLLAAGGDLSSDRLVAAYRAGIFPWFNEDQPILWWSPSPRCVIFPNKIHVSKSLRKKLNKGQLRVSFDEDFDTVVNHCAATREYGEGTWITDEMQDAYSMLHQRGIAHSVEVWRDDHLVGGLYGLAIGRCFFGESMFSLETDSSKIAFTYLCNQLNEWGYSLIDCQVENPHLLSLGAENIERSEFQTILKNSIDQKPNHSAWLFTWTWKANTKK